MWRENEWVLGNPSSTPANIVAAEGILRGLPASRVVVFDAEQAAAITHFDYREVCDWASSSRPPFARTLYDFGGVEVGGGWLLIGALWDDRERAVACQLRMARTNDWSTVFIFLDKLKIDVPFSGGLLGDVVHVDDARYSDERIIEVLVGASMVLESANVDVVEAFGPPRGHRAHGTPHYDVVIRQNQRRTIKHGPGIPQDWSHRWEVRGHFKHFRKGPTFNANPNRRVTDRSGVECVRIWCPPHVKGPDDKPLIPKRRTVAA